jgi:hypothetical protein
MAWSHRTDGRAEDFTQWGRGSGLPWGQGSGLGLRPALPSSWHCAFPERFPADLLGAALLPVLGSLGRPEPCPTELPGQAGALLHWALAGQVEPYITGMPVCHFLV